MKILFIEDHLLVREAISLVVEQLAAEVVVLEAGTCAEGLQQAEEHRDIDLVLLDLGLPDGNGLVAMRSLHERLPRARIVVMSGSQSPNDVAEAIEQGARGFITKNETIPVMLSALRLIIAGGVYVPYELASGAKESSLTLASNSPVPLTPRQLEILRLLAAGMSNKEIARETGTSGSTVRAHVSAILRALQVQNRTEAALAATRLSLDS